MINKNHEDYFKYKEAFDILVAEEKTKFKMLNHQMLNDLMGNIQKYINNTH